MTRTLAERLHLALLHLSSKPKGMRCSFNTDARGLARPSRERGTTQAAEFFWAPELSQASQSPARKMEVLAPAPQCQRSRPIWWLPPEDLGAWWAPPQETSRPDALPGRGQVWRVGTPSSVGVTMVKRWIEVILNKDTKCQMKIKFFNIIRIPAVPSKGWAHLYPTLPTRPSWEGWASNAVLLV